MLAARRFVCLSAAALFVALVVIPANAQPLLITPGATGASANPAPPTVAEKRDENAAQLKLAMRKLETKLVAAPLAAD